MRHQHIGSQRHEADGREILDGIVGHFFVQAGIGDEAGTGEEQRIAVIGRMCHDLGADIAVGAAAVLDDKWLAQRLRQALREDAPGRVHATAGGEGNDPFHRAFRIVLRGTGERRAQP